MNNGDHRLLLERAATASMERIRRDGERAPEKMRPLFPYLEKQIFERELDVNRMRRDCAIRDNSLSIFFSDVTGQTPSAYIVARRVETAAAMLRDTDLRIWIVSKLVGFSYQVVLTRNFKVCYGLTPQAFRTGTRKIFTKAGSRTVGFPSVEELRSALAHGPESAEATALVRRIKRHSIPPCALPPAPAPAPRRQEAEKPLTLFFTEGELERFKIQSVWEELQERSWPDQREMVRNGLAFSTPVFFHFLRKKSIPEGRDNRRFGVHLAELALDCLRVTEQVIGKDLFDLRAQGWAWTGNARRLADDLDGAEAAFSSARTYLETRGSESLVHAEYFGMKSALRLWQRRLDEASELNHRALTIFRAMGTPKEIATYLITGAYTHQRAGKDEQSIEYYEEALRLLSTQVEPYLEFAACFNLTNAYTKIGALGKAKEMLPRARELRAAADSGEESLHFLQWVEARLVDGLGDLKSAADGYQVARAGFLRIGKNIEAALVSLDFALHCWKQGRLSQVRDLTFKIIPLLEAVQYHTEVAAALKLLRFAIEKKAVTQKVLQDVREHLDRDRFDPWT
ncbi:MAG: helix-turn-helix domain-containing protein [bacterium]|nr:helix-turn-helix domain-containing protein [bacterium]